MTESKVDLIYFNVGNVDESRNANDTRKMFRFEEGDIKTKIDELLNTKTYLRRNGNSGVAERPP